MLLVVGPALWAVMGPGIPVRAEAPASTGPGLILVLAGGLAWEDLGPPAGAALGPLRDRAVVGLVTVGPGEPADPWTRHLSLGSGARVVFPRGPLPQAAVPEAAIEGIPARVLWHSLTGRAVPDRAGLLVFLPPEVRTGARLGDALRAAGRALVLIGGGSEAGEAPPAAALLAGADGLVLGAVLAEPLRTDGGWPGLERTDWERLEALASGAFDADLLVVQWGDLERLERWKELLPAERYRALRRSAVAEALAWIERAASRLAEGERVLLLSTAPPRSHPARSPAPLVLLSGTGDGTGLATSGSTRRPGILDPADLAPTLLALLGAPESWKGTGRPMTVVARAAPLASLDRFYRTAVGVSELRRPVLHSYIVVFGGMVLAAALLFALAPEARAGHPVHRWLGFGILMASSAPLAMLIPSLLTTSGRVHLALMVLIAAVVAWLLSARVSLPWRFPVLAAATFLVLAVDIATGAMLQLHAFLGNDPLGGARYYGVGNEYMGILLGSGLVSVGALWEWQRAAVGRWAGVFGLAALVVLLGHPRLGANVGGTVAALFGSAYLLLRLRKQAPRWSELALIGLGSLGVLALLGVGEALAVEPAARSHLGHLVARMLAEGWGPLLETASRKVATNLKLVEYTVWSRVLIATLVAFVLLLYRPVGLFRQLMDRRPFMGRGIEAALVAALTALVANDSGVLAAATAMIPTMSTLLAALYETRAAR